LIEIGSTALLLYLEFFQQGFCHCF